MECLHTFEVSVKSKFWPCNLIYRGEGPGAIDFTLKTSQADFFFPKPETPLITVWWKES